MQKWKVGLCHMTKVWARGAALALVSVNNLALMAGTAPEALQVQTAFVVTVPPLHSGPHPL